MLRVIKRRAKVGPARGRSGKSRGWRLLQTVAVTQAVQSK